MMEYVIGIDPGKTGGIVILDGHDGSVCDKMETPSIAKDIDWNAFADVLRTFDRPHVYIEKVHAIHGSAAGATFTFGGCFHGAVALCCALKLPHTLVEPKVWQKVMHAGVQEIRKPSYTITKPGKFFGQTRKGNRDAKAMSLVAAKRLFPNVSLLKTPRCTKPHDGIYDALLIAEYGRRILCR